MTTTTGRTLTTDQDRALTVFLDNIGQDTLAEVGSHLTCGEADTIAALFSAFGYDADAAALIAGHAEDDDEGDSHYQEDPADVAHREAGKCAQRYDAPSGFVSRCGAAAEDNGYCTTHAHLSDD